MDAINNRLTRGQRAMLAFLLGSNFISGAAHAAWGWLAEPGATPPYLLIQIHGWTVPFLLILTGAFVPLHLQPGWHSRRNRLSGAAFAAALVCLTLTGFGLYYIGNESLRAAARAIHIAAGLALPLLLAAHILAGRRTRANGAAAANGF